MILVLTGVVVVVEVGEATEERLPLTVSCLRATSKPVTHPTLPPPSAKLVYITTAVSRFPFPLVLPKDKYNR